MKNKNLFFALVAGFAFTIASCGGGGEEAIVTEEPTATEETIEAAEEAEAVELAYYCPMKCEGETTYAEPGQCGVCGMDLVANQ